MSTHGELRLQLTPALCLGWTPLTVGFMCARLCPKHFKLISWKLQEAGPDVII